MITHTLENQVENLQSEEHYVTGEEYVEKSEVVDLIRGYEEDLYDMEDERALEEAHDILYETHQNLQDELNDLQNTRDGEPFINLFLGPMLNMIEDEAQFYLTDLEIGMDVLGEELEKA